MIRAFVRGVPVQIRNPNAVRPWQHVLEPLRGYLAICERLLDDGPTFGEAWNFGPEPSDAKPVEWIVERLVSMWGDGASWRADDGLHPHEAAMLRLDWSKAAARLGWRPQLGLAEALSATATWYSAWARHENLRELTLDQITRLGGRFVQAANAEK